MSEKEMLFLRSALTEENPFISTSAVLDWLAHRNQAVNVKIERIKFKEMNRWGFEANSGNLTHDSGGFFSIEGLHVKTNWGLVNEWMQPIINQPEIGFLGIITREVNGVLYFLMQAKIEPGNVNNVQLSPTLQATKSNYSQLHKGNKPRYLEYFLDRKNNAVLLDQLQSEQGARFLKKRNRNIIIKVDGEIDAHEDFRWLTLGQIKKLIQFDNIVNMDTRTVISGIFFPAFEDSLFRVNPSVLDNNLSAGLFRSMLDRDTSLYNIDCLLSWLTQQKSSYDLYTKSIPLNSLSSWIIDDYEISHEEGKYFKVIGVNVQIGNREIKSWSQPLVKPSQEGICAFIIKEIEGTYHYLVQSKLECGNLDTLELAPTVQCLTGNYRESKKPLPFLEYVLNAPRERVKYSALQSEEGGRFYREQNRNLLIEADEDFPIDVPENYNWFTLNQLLFFLKFNNYLNIQSRSLISSVAFI